MAESFFQLLKRERIKKRVYKNRADVKADLFDYIERFYHARRCHRVCEDQAPAEYESARFMRHGTVWETQVYSDHIADFRLANAVRYMPINHPELPIAG